MQFRLFPVPGRTASPGHRECNLKAVADNRSTRGLLRAALTVGR